MHNGKDNPLDKHGQMTEIKWGSKVKKKKKSMEEEISGGGVQRGTSKTRSPSR